MSVASHLGIRLTEYDARIRTFIPDYEAMIECAASVVPVRARTIVDLGIGTGALAARCLAYASRARVVGIDADAGILELASRRLGDRLTAVAGSFLRVPLPVCDAAVASFSLHHVRTRGAKAALYRRVRASLLPRGRLIIVDCQPARDPSLWIAQRRAWLDHLRATYSDAQARDFLEAWSREDVYVPLESEVELLRRSGLRAEIVWRRQAFAVLSAAARG
jgi:ubiquinone/menaquinone biosynthesis C-methylase UbiE